MIAPNNIAPVVCHVCSQYLSRSETFIYSLIASLRSVTPTVLSYQQPINLDLFPFDETRIHHLGKSLNRWHNLPRRAASKLTGGDWTRPAYERQYKAVGARWKPSMLHAHFGPVGYAALSMQRLWGVPLVTTFYGFDTKSVLLDGAWPEKRAELFDKADLILVEGAFMRSQLIRLGCAPHKIALQKIGITLPSPTRKPDRGCPIVLFAGRFVEKKGLIYGLEAVDKLIRRRLEFRCRIVGDGPLDGELRRFVANRGIADRVEFLGFLTHRQYLAELRSADMLVQPSVTAADGDNEGGAPTTILEAQGFGVPVVSTRHADIPNVVSEGRSALLAPERSSEELAEAIALLLKDRDRRVEMGRAGRAFVEENHNCDVQARRMEEKYAGLLR